MAFTSCIGVKDVCLIFDTSFSFEGHIDITMTAIVILDTFFTLINMMLYDAEKLLPAFVIIKLDY